jgi:hypothetical protein
MPILLSTWEVEAEGSQERPAWLHSKFRASLFYLSSKRKKQKERVERGRERERQREKHVGYLKKFFFIVLGGGTL